MDWDYVARETTFIDEVYFPRSERRKAQWAITAEAVARLLDLQEDDSVLELCCGTAAIGVELARRGCAVTGVDASEAMLERARRRARDAGVELGLVRMDVAEVGTLGGLFDAALWLDVSFGAAPAGSERGLLADIRRLLKPGGTLLLEAYRLEHFEARPEVRFTGDEFEVLLARIGEGGELVSSLRATTPGGSPAELQQGRGRAYTARQLRDLLEGAGFSRMELLSTLSGESAPATSPSVFARARVA